MLTFKGALCAGGVKYAAVRKSPEALFASPTRFPFEDRRGPPPGHFRWSSLLCVCSDSLTLSPHMQARPAQRLTMCSLRRFEHRGKESAPADATSEQLIEFLEPLVTPARAQRIRQVHHRPAQQAWLLSSRPGACRPSSPVTSTSTANQCSVLF